MILAPEQRSPTWQSPDDYMEAGTAQAGNLPFYYISLGNRPVVLDDVQALIRFMGQLNQAMPLLLLSNCPGFEPSTEAERQGLVFYAGQYRSLQQQERETGRLILSYAHQIAVGGTYLMHGLSANVKALAPDTRFHDSIPSRPPVPIPQVVARGLADVIVPPADFPNWLEAQLHISPSGTQP